MILRVRGGELMLHHAPSRMMNIGFIRCRQSLQNSRLWDCRRLFRNRSQRSVVENQRQRKDQPSSVLEDARERMIITLPDFYSPTNWESIIKILFGSFSSARTYSTKILLCKIKCRYSLLQKRIICPISPARPASGRHTARRWPAPVPRPGAETEQYGYCCPGDPCRRGRWRRHWSW